MVRLQPPEPDASEEQQEKPVAVLGIDLGVRKAACATLITEKKTGETRYFRQPVKARLIERYDRMVASH